MLLRRVLLLLVLCFAVTPSLAFGDDVSFKTGKCPRFPEDTITPCIAYCIKDSDCKEDMKCCPVGCMQKCVKPVSFKTGKCPRFPEDTITPCIAYCIKDSDCKEDMKCCPVGCMQKCVKPEP
ncbi:nigwaprin-b-like [Penaeus monodon]|uniref:nigwaprin-b-like n=1 Tax=Penaeus monodon TaxID=6687 RepID=UPI0018A72CE5|nr:nigwaprin-b-like [Penaeus monodon]